MTPLERFSEDGPHQPLAPTDYLQCRVCDAVFTSADYLGGLEAPTTEGVAGSSGRCPVCGEWGKFVRRSATPRRAFAAQWPGARGGFVQVPNALLKHAALLGLDAMDVALMAAFESARLGRPLDAAVSRPVKDVAGELGVSDRVVRGRVNKWVDHGLWRKEARRGPDGGNAPFALWRPGLTAALALITENHAAGRALDEGLPMLLEMHKQSAPRQQVPHPPAATATPPGTDCRATQEGGQEEGQELPQRQPDPPARVLSEDELIKRLIDEFDAIEVTEAVTA